MHLHSFKWIRGAGVPYITINLFNGVNVAVCVWESRLNVSYQLSRFPLFFVHHLLAPRLQMLIAYKRFNSSLWKMEKMFDAKDTSVFNQEDNHNNFEKSNNATDDIFDLLFFCFLAVCLHIFLVWIYRILFIGFDINKSFNIF